MTRDEATACVARGAALLDEKRPGWAHALNLGKLDLSSCTACVLGQLWRRRGRGFPFLAATRELFKGASDGNDREVSHGFASGSGYPEEWFGWLQDAWIVAIADRVVRAEPSPSLGEARSVEVTR